jgi:hypothetical protein
MTTTDDGMARYTKSETATFTFIGRAESDTAANLLDKVEECLIGLNLEPQQGWAWIADGKATAGNFVELLGARIAHVLQTSADLDQVTRAALAMQLAESIAEIAPTLTEATSSRPRNQTPTADPV